MSLGVKIISPLALIVIDAHFAVSDEPDFTVCSATCRSSKFVTMKEISETGYWNGETSHIHHVHCKELSKWICEFLE